MLRRDLLGQGEFFEWKFELDTVMSLTSLSFFKIQVFSPSKCCLFLTNQYYTYVFMLISIDSSGKSQKTQICFFLSYTIVEFLLLCFLLNILTIFGNNVGMGSKCHCETWKQWHFLTEHISIFGENCCACVE